MSFAWVTDPHLDRASEAAAERFLAALRESGGEVVIVTGDISNSRRLSADLRRMSAAAQRPLYFVLGNHDHYGSSVGRVRDEVLALASSDPRVQWLPPRGVVHLQNDTVLVGVDGWADGRHGDPLNTPLRLNDDRLIEELAQQESRVGKLAVRRILADADAARLQKLLSQAATSSPARILVATHVPPFVSALQPGSREAHADWHPILVSGATGTVLQAFAAERPGVSITVLSGHSHRGHRARVAPNLEVVVGAARYGSPEVVVVD